MERVTRRRLPGWEAALAEEVQRAALHSFAWGARDCALWACDVVKAMTGVDPAVHLRGYVDARGAWRALHRATGTVNLAEGVARIAARGGWPEIEPAMAQRGDFVIVPLQNGPTCGICLGAAVAATGLDGVVFAGSQLITRAWAV